MTTQFDLYFRQTNDAGGDDVSRHVGTVDYEDLDELAETIRGHGGLYDDPDGYSYSIQFTPLGVEVVFVEGGGS